MDSTMDRPPVHSLAAMWAARVALALRRGGRVAWPALLLPLAAAQTQNPPPAKGARTAPAASAAQPPGTLQKVGSAVERGVKSATGLAERGVSAAASGVKAAGAAVERGAKAAGSAVSTGARKAGLPAEPASPPARSK
jgi:hypothetical protein